jgi:CspA family cold shock protein
MIDSPVTSGGCWTHFSDIAQPGGGYRSLRVGQRVEVEHELPGQDGYPYRAVRVWPHGDEPIDTDSEEDGPSAAFGSSLSIDWNDQADPRGRG